MGRRGPPPKPTALRVLQGNPGKLPLNKREPQPRSLAPSCPVWLEPTAKTIWRKTVPELRRLGLLTIVDREALAAYCQAYARWQQAEQFITRHGTVFPVRDEAGQIKYMQQFPQVSIAQKYLQLMQRFASEFGFTPASRTRIQIPLPTQGESETEQRIFGT